VIFLKDSGCAYTDLLAWYNYELAAKFGTNGGQVDPPSWATAASLTWGLAKNLAQNNACIIHSGRWAIFQLYFKVSLDWGWFGSSTVYSFDKYFVSK
jgi:hypothetical protein